MTSPMCMEIVWTYVLSIGCSTMRNTLKSALVHGQWVFVQLDTVAELH